MTSPREAAAYLVPLYGSRRVEHLGIVLLDTRYRLLQTVLLSVGVIDGACTHPRDVFREALAGGAAAVVLFHNHPSGDAWPSGPDAVRAFQDILAGYGLPSTVRQRRGIDIDAGCGQLKAAVERPRRTLQPTAS